MQPIETFRNRLPSHGFATDDLAYGLRFVPVVDLIQKAIIQYNWRHSITWLVYDLDSPTARFDWGDRNCPPPNIQALNRDNGHAHLLYGLRVPVHNYPETAKKPAARKKPLRFLAAIDVALTAELGADPGYSKLLCKNPLHDRWDVSYPRILLYDLDELADWVDLDKYQDRRRRLPTVGYGRNCTLFETLRIWAYRARRQPFLSEEMFREAVLHHALVINAGFSPPLPHNEVRSTAKSVSRWVWRKMSVEGFKAYQSAMGKRSGAARHAKAMELRANIIQTAIDCPTLTQADWAAMNGVTRETVNRHLRSVTRTISDNRPSETDSDLRDEGLTQ